jgi:calcineurin-like phosphoesterase family protein
MDDALVERWNGAVRDEDTVMILGDLAMGNLERSLERVRELKGLKLLVPGNHDRVSSLYKGSPAKKAEWAVAYREAGIRVQDEEFVTMIGTHRVMVSHFPYEGDSHGEDRYQWSRPRDEGLPLIHGHVHEAWKVRGRQINVGTDVWNFTPVRESVIVELLAEISVQQP